MLWAWEVEEEYNNPVSGNPQMKTLKSVVSWRQVCTHFFFFKTWRRYELIVVTLDALDESKWRGTIINNCHGSSDRLSMTNSKSSEQLPSVPTEVEESPCPSHPNDSWCRPLRPWWRSSVPTIAEVTGLLLSILVCCLLFLDYINFQFSSSFFVVHLVTILKGSFEEVLVEKVILPKGLTLSLFFSWKRLFWMEGVIHLVLSNSCSIPSWGGLQLCRGPPS